MPQDRGEFSPAGCSVSLKIWQHELSLILYKVLSPSAKAGFFTKDNLKKQLHFLKEGALNDHANQGNYAVRFKYAQL